FTMRSIRRLAGNTVVELLACVAVLAALLVLILPAVLSAQEKSNRNACANNMKQIGLALLNYEDKRHCLPPISSNYDTKADIPGDATVTTDAAHPAPGSAPSTGAGYSWTVFILPEIEQTNVYYALSTTSDKFTKPAFSPEVKSDYNLQTPNVVFPH